MPWGWGGGRRNSFDGRFDPFVVWGGWRGAEGVEAKETRGLGGARGGEE